MKALVTDGNNRAALAITRALGQAGFEVIVAAETGTSLAGQSKFCTQRVTYPSPQKWSREFVDSLHKAVKRYNPDILLPVSDITTMTLNSYRDKFNGQCSMPFPSQDIVQRAADKVEILKEAKTLGVSVPKSIVVQSLSDFKEAGSIEEALGFPVVLKPHKSRVVVNGQWQSTSVKYARDNQEIERLLQAMPDEHYPVLLQEKISGPGVGIFLCMQKGEVVASFRHERIREKPPSGGVSVLRKSAPQIPELVEESKRLLGLLDWFGVAMVEYKHDLREGSYKFMEINGRFWGSLQLAIDAGINFPVILTNMALKNDFDPVLSYKVGVKTRWLLGDLDSLLTTLLGSSDWNPSYRSRSKWKALREFLKLWEKDMHYEILKKEDIRPWIYELKTWLKRGN